MVFELAGGHICAPPPPGRAKVVQTHGRARGKGICQTSRRELDGGAP